MMHHSRVLLLLLAAIGFVSAGLSRAQAQDTTPDINVVAYTGEQESNAPAGSDYLLFFTPEVGPFLASVTPPSPITSATNVFDIGGLYGNFSKSVRVAGLTQPTGYCDIVTLAPGFGGITGADNKVMIGGDLFYQQDTDLFAETGVALDGLPEGVTFKNFYNMDGNYYPVFFATLQGTGITSANSLALCTIGENEDDVIRKSTANFDYPIDILVEVGDTVLTSGDNTKVVKSITCLTGSKGTLADGRWRTSIYFGEDADDGYENSFLVLLTFTDGSQGLFVIPSDNVHTDLDSGSYAWTELPRTGPQFDIDGLNEGSAITSFGLPSIDPVNFAVLANVTVSGSLQLLKTATAAPNALPITSSSTVDLIVGPAAGGSIQYVMARLGDSVPADANGNEWSGVTIGGFSDPVVGDYGEVACLVTLHSTESKPFAGIEFSGTSQGLSLIANVGAAAPDVTGTGTVGHWSGFKSLVLPAIGGQLYFEDLLLHKNLARPSLQPVQTDSCGPIFVGTLKISSADGVNASNDLGIWALDGYGLLQLIFRSGQTVEVNGINKKVLTFTALDAAPGSLGAAMGYNEYGEVAVIATFTDGTTAMLWVSVPGVDIGG